MAGILLTRLGGAVLASLLVSAALLLHAPAAHAVTRCSIGDSGVTYNRADVGAQFENLRAMRGMNCESARYVLNKWLRRHFRRSYSRKLPTGFWDGYVTWDCWKRTSLQWQCDEYDSYTSFRFRAYTF